MKELRSRATELAPDKERVSRALRKEERGRPVDSRRRMVLDEGGVLLDPRDPNPKSSHMAG